MERLMPDESTAPGEPPRQGLTYLRVMELELARRRDETVLVTPEELNELLRAWLRLTDLAPNWQREQP
jgi:hypothetical protein